jgi:hypothetical protein
MGKRSPPDEIGGVVARRSRIHLRRHSCDYTCWTAVGLRRSTSPSAREPPLLVRAVPGQKRLDASPRRGPYALCGPIPVRSGCILGPTQNGSGCPAFGGGDSLLAPASRCVATAARQKPAGKTGRGRIVGSDPSGGLVCGARGRCGDRASRTPIGLRLLDHIQLGRGGRAPAARFLPRSEDIRVESGPPCPLQPIGAPELSFKTARHEVPLHPAGVPFSSLRTDDCSGGARAMEHPHPDSSSAASCGMDVRWAPGAPLGRRSFVVPTQRRAFWRVAIWHHTLTADYGAGSSRTTPRLRSSRTRRRSHS